MSKSSKIINHENQWRDSDVRAFWDRIAPVYIRENRRISEAHNQRFEEATASLQLKKAHRILNISSRDCGALNHLPLSHAGPRITHAEISMGLIKVAKEIHPNAEQVCIESYSMLPFTDGSFDRILSLETIEHTANPIGFLSELYRVSSEDSIMVMSCPPRTSEIPYRIFTKFAGGHGEGPHRFLHSKEVKAMLGKTRWRLLRHWGTLLVPIGPKFLRWAGEQLIRKCQGTFISEWGIRQFYLCAKVEK